MEIFKTVFTALIGGGFFAFIEFLITRKDKKKGFIHYVINKLDKLERDSVRLNLLYMIKFNPDNIEEIMTIAQHYFEDLKGNWFVTSIFLRWLAEHNIEKPVWLGK